MKQSHVNICYENSYIFKCVCDRMPKNIMSCKK